MDEIYDDYKTFIKIQIIIVVIAVGLRLIYNLIEYKTVFPQEKDPLVKFYELQLSDRSIIKDSLIEEDTFFRKGHLIYYKTNIISAREITNIQKK
ncbi:hypothetical protein HZP42_15755 [Elizabethkingia anophelis]|nr:hypothetical protein [Elizabethkingia anophelis]